ncbi:MAG: DMT family transporter [Thaumarchaeota archaeon]|nr:DMT family transporter [Nitrososphaerota archaeon]
MVNLRAYSLLVTLSVIWGMAFVAIRVADFELSAVNLTLLRWLIVSGSFAVLYPFIGKPKVPFERKDAPRLLVVAFATVAAYHLALNFSEKIVNASLAGLLISLAPLFVVILSALVLKEKIGRTLRVALLLALAGAVTISLPDLSLGSGGILGPLLVVVASLSSAVNTVLSKPLVLKYGPFPVAIWGALLGTAMLLPLASGSLLREAATLSVNGWTSVLYLSLLSTVLANLIFYTLVGRGALSRLGVQLYLVPLVSVIGGVAILHESLVVETVAGGALLLVAVGLTTRVRH